jgi:hypothetical protein
MLVLPGIGLRVCSNGPAPVSHKALMPGTVTRVEAVGLSAKPRHTRKA